ncbi:glycerophosphodiester phosphodiesterase [Mesorhizobium silamurunense]|uniref:glycerophosphodiester phosphodiesterase n=1 Tax=Mesorhizobium silamurunense TaxID=499528 RepID=UPI00177E1E29|nr:glycerophosphodiester phosphodiesterase [Mesorhizobium silamurunense]
MIDIQNLWRRPAARRRLRPLIIAHRGASAQAPENTIAAFNAAIASQADAFETDVILTRDRIAICHHDLTCRTTSEDVLHYTRDLDCHDLVLLLPYVPTLAQACRIALPIFLDIKEAEAADIFNILALPEISAAPHRFLVGVHSVSTAEAIADRHPGIAQVSLIATRDENEVFTRTLPGQWVRLRHADASQHAISRMKDARMQVMITCGGGKRPVGDAVPSEIAELAAAGVDALIVNDPELAHRVFQQRSAMTGPQ